MNDATEPFVPTRARFNGTLMQAWFTTDLDFAGMMPPSLEIVGPTNRAFIKVYDLKMRAVGGPQRRPGYSQYRQACVSTLVRPVGTDLEPRQHNFMMWEARPWALGTGGLAWPKRKATIEMTAIWPSEFLFQDSDEPLDYRVDIREYETPLMTFDGVLDGEKTIDLPPLNGFYIPDYDEMAVYLLPFVDTYYGEPKWGSKATLNFSPADGEVGAPSVLKDSAGRPLGRLGIGQLGDVQVEGFGVSDVMFLRQYDQIERIPLPLS
jgi:hypothetical protein